MHMLQTRVGFYHGFQVGNLVDLGGAAVIRHGHAMDAPEWLHNGSTIDAEYTKYYGKLCEYRHR